MSTIVLDLPSEEENSRVESSSIQQTDGQVDGPEPFLPSVEDDEALARRLQSEWDANDPVASGSAAPRTLNTVNPGTSPQQQQQQQTPETASAATTKPKVATVSNAWGFDVEQSRCASCNDEFNAFNRRHHCRLCGKIFCNRCSDKRALIPPSAIVLTPSKGGKKAPPPSQTDSTSFTPDPDPDRMLTYIDEDKQLLYGKGLEER